jgi:hypothetical protein
LVALIVLLIFFIVPQVHAQDYCANIIFRIVPPIPAMQNGRLLDARERFELSARHVEVYDKVNNLLSDYLQLRMEIEEKGNYFNWQWKRVDAGIEYKRDIWKEQIKEYLPVKAKMNAIEKQLSALGITQKELDLCYKSLRY